ncbi:hypothetical protein GAS19_03710 [Burkholderia glumae]|nr:hypothetical protein NCPPB3923_24020 [Burkholderia glumae]PNL00675.1 hypothetical protein CEQ24_016420 [Burkholderia glumae]QGA36874.1 hypothetical protein GAS19_03710 [Burkholderia glumae]
MRRARPLKVFRRARSARDADPAAAAPRTISMKSADTGLASRVRRPRLISTIGTPPASGRRR